MTLLPSFPRRTRIVIPRENLQTRYIIRPLQYVYIHACAQMPRDMIMERPDAWRNGGGLLDQDQAHSLGVLNTARSSFSLAPALVWSSPISLWLTPVPHHGCMYSQRAVSGRLIRILSTRAPGVLRPKLVPLSFTRLNSTYRPRRICCHVLCSGK
jgi:hypothetical protein